MQTAQIQIQPVENGYIMQAVNLDGERLNKRHVASTRDEMVKQVKAYADELFVPVKTEAKAPAAPAAKK
jgi:hypothetical protein